MKILKKHDGQALVEFAIVLPILLLLVMGIIQFGLLLSSYLTLENAAREGARNGIIGCTDSEIQGAITSASPNLDPAKLTISVTPSRESGDTLTVNLTYDYDLTVPIISSIFGNTVVLNAQTSMRIE